MSEIKNPFQTATTSAPTAFAPQAAARPGPVAPVGGSDADLFGMRQSESGFNFSGIDSLGEPVKGFVQTSDLELASNGLERAGIRVYSINPRSGRRQTNRRPTSVEFATLAEQFGDLME